MSPDLSTTYLGLSLRSPLSVSSCPLTGELDTLAELEKAGAAAVVLPSLFEEQLVRDELQLDQVLEQGAHAFGESLTYFPEMPDYGVGPDSYLSLVSAAKQRLSIPVIASLNADSTGSWVNYAQLLQAAGADAVELNAYLIAADTEKSASQVEDDYLELVRDVRSALDIPMAVKLSPFFSSFANMAVRIDAAGADGLVMFNRFYQPDLDLETLDVVPSIELSQPWELRLPLRWIAILYGRVDASLAATSGVSDARGVAKVLLAGGDAAMMASALLLHGVRHLETVERHLVSWMEENEYDSVSRLKGSMSYRGTANPAAYERTNYMRTLASYD